MYADSVLAALDEELSFVKSLEEIETAVHSIMRFGWEADIYGRKIRDWYDKLKSYAASGLDALEASGERQYLENV